MKIWIATGGTGGHVFPALAVAAELARRHHNIIISSDGRTINMVKKNRPERAGVAFIWADGVGAKSKIKQAIALFKIGISTIALVLRWTFFRPARVVSFGGYASVAPVLAAKLWKIPTFLHEQNAAIGRANKFALRWVDVLMTSFPIVSGVGSRRFVTPAKAGAGVVNKNANLKTVYTGLPVRKEFLTNDSRPGLRRGDKPPTPDSREFRLLITGGSLGAQILDEIVPSAIIALPAAIKKKLFVVHQTRPESVTRFQKFYAENKIRANVLSFISDMAGEMWAADLVIGRAGASTVVELQTLGRPAILVPLGINPDQAANAAAFAKTGGGFDIPQDKFTVKWLSATLSELFENPARLAKMAEKANVPNNAVENIADLVSKSPRKI